jgi:hypothetical protein
MISSLCDKQQVVDRLITVNDENYALFKKQ